MRIEDEDARARARSAFTVLIRWVIQRHCNLDLKCARRKWNIAIIPRPLDNDPEVPC
jgi:hypothetical protein